MPPHNLDAEQALLGAILFDNETLNRISPRLQARHFYDPLHGRIFAACYELVSAGRVADGLTLKAHFANDDAMFSIGGVRYLMTLMDVASPLSAQAQAYADLIVDLALRRELIRLSGEISGAAMTEGAVGADALLERAETALFDLAERGEVAGGFAPIGDAVTTSVDMVLQAYRNGGDVSGIPTGFVDLDRMLGGLHDTDLVILAGRPSMGKTALAVNIANNAAQSLAPGAGVVGFFSLEMSAPQLALRMLSERAEIESDRLRRGKLTRPEFDRLTDEATNLRALPLHLDETGSISIAALRARARRLQRQKKLALIVVDYLQLMTSGRDRRENRVQEVSEITQGLKAVAKDLRVPVLALSQLSRKVEEREDKRPKLSDLRESGSIEQDADVVMFVYREEYYLEREEPRDGTDDHIEWGRRMDQARNHAEVIIGKQRHGPIGKVKLQFDSRFTRFSSVPNHDPDDF